MPSHHISRQNTTPAKRARAQELRAAPTLAESRLWARLRGGRLGGWHFRRQHVVEPFIVDFYCHRAALVVEVDGGIHAQQAEQDQQRELALQARGLRVIRFSNEAVLQQINTVLAEILLACESKDNQNGGTNMAEIKYTIVKKIGVLSKTEKGWAKELNLISWNDREPKYDIRDWSPDGQTMGKGVTLSKEELAALRELLKGIEL